MGAARNPTLFAALLVVAAAISPFDSTQVSVSANAASRKLDSLLQERASHSTGWSRVIIRASSDLPANLAPIIEQAGGTLGRRLTKIASHVAFVPNGALRRLAASPFVERISLDRDIVGAMERTGATVGAPAVRQELGFNGSGIGVAIIDSGVTPWHDDLSNAAGAQRVVRFVDFVNGAQTPYDDYGHGTHVAGIIAGNGFDSNGARSGIAPGANLIVLKVLDAQGRGHLSNVIAALDYAVEHRSELNIRVVNVSVASGVYESYDLDPLTLAAQRAVAAGITVIAAAGNNGRSAAGHTQYGGVTSPGNAPWVLTVGASSHMGTVDRADDTIAAFSSRGPGAINGGAKPDLVAPGVGIESLANPNSALYSSASAYLLSGTVGTSYLPYLSLSGTSMSAPVVAGTVALMLQANPLLTPNEVKAILQFTSQVYPSSDPLTEGAGFLNTKGAVELANYVGDPLSTRYPDDSMWGKRLIWGNRMVWGGTLTRDANAWWTNVMWGALTVDGRATWFGLVCSNADCSSTAGKWRPDRGDWYNVVWGAICAGNDCAIPWTVDVVSTTTGGETVVWGTDSGETVVWGTESGETVVWGTNCTDPSCIPVIWSGR